MKICQINLADFMWKFTFIVIFRKNGDFVCPYYSFRNCEPRDEHGGKTFKDVGKMNLCDKNYVLCLSNLEVILSFCLQKCANIVFSGFRNTNFYTQNVIFESFFLCPKKRKKNLILFDTIHTVLFRVIDKFIPSIS